MIKTLLRTAALGALLLLAACNRPDGTTAGATAEPPSTLRVYTVPAERAQALQDALVVALGKNGRVSLAPPDRLIVVAPQVLQTSVAENLGELMKATPPAAPDPGPVRLVTWVVDVAEVATVDTRLKPIESTLAALRESLAAPGFSLYAQSAITGDVGDRAPGQSARDGRLQLEARMSPVADGVRANIEVVAGRLQFVTQTRLTFGETVVLAQAMPEDAGGSRVRLVIVRADPAG